MIKLKNWPFDKGEYARILRITSPLSNEETKNLYSNVYFQSETTQEIKWVSIQWGVMPLLWIGQRFVNGSLVDETKTRRRKSIKLSEVSDMEYHKIKIEGENNLIDPNEYYLTFSYEEKIYCIPCIEITRAFYLLNSVFANYILSSDSIENFVVQDTLKITPVDNNEPQITFDLNIKDYDFPNLRNAAKFFSIIYGLYTLRRGWKYIEQKYRLEKKIIALLPRKIPDGKLLISNLCNIDNMIFIGHIVPSFSIPYSDIIYGPEGKIKDEPVSKQKFTAKQTTGDIEIGGPETKAGPQSPQAINVDSNTIQVKNMAKLHRKTPKRSPEKRTRRIPIETEGMTTTTAPYGSNGNVQRGSIESCTKTEENEFNSEFVSIFPEFELIIQAMNRLSYSGQLSYSTDVINLSSLKKNAFTSSGGEFGRNCAILKTVFNNVNYLILEVSTSDGYSISTLFLKNAENTEINYLTLLAKMISKGGHWGSALLESYKHLTLNHHYNRSDKVLADNILKKLTALSQ